MTTYTTVADANGDFTVPFSSSHTSGERITVIAEKDNAIKTIELYAPSDVVGGGVVRFSGTAMNFPNEIGGVEVDVDLIPAYAFSAASNAGVLWRKANSLDISNASYIGSYAFDNWSSIESVVFSPTLNHIGAGAFQACEKITSLVIPELVTAIGDYSFYYCPGLKTLTFMGQITAIGNQSFAYCSNLESLVLPASITRLGVNAFLNASKLGSITCLAVNPPTIQSNSFTSLPAGCVIKVPAGSVAAYQAAPNWSAFASRIQAI